MYHYYINSAKRLEYANTKDCNFSYVIEGIPTECDTVCVLKASIPMSFYLIQDTYNTFQFIENGIWTVCTIPIGNYSATTFISTLMPLLTQLSPHQWVYSALFNNNIGKYTFSVANNNLQQPSFICTNNVYAQLGFDQNSYNQFVNNVLSSKNVVDFITESTIFIRSDMVAGQTNILQEIYTNNASAFSKCTYMCPDVDRYSKSLASTHGVFHFSFTDEYGRQQDTNGQNILLTLVFYKKDNLTDIMKTFTQYTVMRDQTDIAAK